MLSDPAALVVVFLSDPSPRRTLRYHPFCASSGVLAPLVQLVSTPVPTDLLFRFHQFLPRSPMTPLSTLARSATCDRWGKKPLKGRVGSRRVEWRFDIWKEARHGDGIRWVRLDALHQVVYCTLCMFHRSEESLEMCLLQNTTSEILASFLQPNVKVRRP